MRKVEKALEEDIKNKTNVKDRYSNRRSQTLDEERDLLRIPFTPCQSQNANLPYENPSNLYKSLFASRELFHPAGTIDEGVKEILLVRTMDPNTNMMTLDENISSKCTTEQPFLEKGHQGISNLWHTT